MIKAIAIVASSIFQTRLRRFLLAGVITAVASVPAAQAGHSHFPGDLEVHLDLHTGRAELDRRQWHDPVYAVQTTRVWVDAVYRPVTARQWVAPVYRTVVDHVWREPVVQNQVIRVWVDGYYADRQLGSGKHARLKRVFVPAHEETRNEQVVIAPGHFEDVTRQEIVSEGHWEDRIVGQQLIAPGHFEDRPERVLVTPGHWEHRPIVCVDGRGLER